MKKEPDSKEILKFIWGRYEFQVYSPTDSLPEGPGLFVFAGRESAQTAWTALYIDRTESLAGLFPNHQCWYRAVQLGATHVHVRVEPQKEIQQEMKKELILHYKPRLNDLCS